VAGLGLRGISCTGTTSTPDKKTGIEIDTGGQVRPCITPDDVEAVTRILDEHVSP
jgi:hypothetical protein